MDDPAPDSQKGLDGTQVDSVKGSLTDSQRLAVRDEVQRLIESEHKKFRTFLGAAVALLAVFGYTTWKDVRTQTAVLVKEEVDALISHGDRETNVKQALDDLIGRSVMTASLVALNKPELIGPDKRVTLRALGPTKDLKLSFDDWRRLEAWIQNPSLALDDFRGALTVLAAQDEERCRQDGRDFLGEMLSPHRGSAYAWMENQPAKRLVILETFIRPGLEISALEIATSSSVSRDLRLAAFDYISAVHFQEAFDKLFPLVASVSDEEVSLRALLTCASLDPLDEQVKQEADKVSGGLATTSKVERAIKLAMTAWYAPSSIGDNAPEIMKSKVKEERLALPRRLLIYAFDHGARLVVLDGEIFEFSVGSKERFHEAFGVKKDTFAQLSPYWDLAEDAAGKNNVARVAQLAPWSAYQSGSKSLQVHLSPTASVKVGQGSARSVVELSKAAGVEWVLLARSKESELAGNRDLMVVWSDKQGHEQEGVLVGFSGSGFRFSLPRSSY
jgi:hypothetical protein